MCWQLILPSFRTPSTLHGRDGSQLPCSWKSSRCIAFHSPKLTLLGTHSVHTLGMWWTSALQISRHPWLDLGRNSSEKSFLDIFIEAVDLWNQKTFCSSVHTSFHRKGFSWAQIFLDRKNTLTKKVIHPAIMKQQQLCFKSWLSVLLLTNATYSPVRAWFLSFNQILDFTWVSPLVKRSFRGFYPNLSCCRPSCQLPMVWIREASSKTP